MKFKFPSSFIFGVADADLQVVGEDEPIAVEGALPSMWGNFAKTSGKVYQNQPPGVGIDRYNRWKEDIEIMKRLGVKHYRTSVSMARLFKKNGEINRKAIDWYEEYFKALRNSGITLYVTLYHWELPQYLNEKGGWKNPKIIEHLVKHSEVVYGYLGEYIEEYFIFNEPWIIAMQGYYFGIAAPGEKSIKSALSAAHNVLLAQGAVYRTLSSLDPEVKLSTVYNTVGYYAASTEKKDLLAAKIGDGQINRWFMDPLFIGKYPEDMLDLYGQNMPKIGDADMDLIKVGSKLYSFGINYYFSAIVKYDEKDYLKFVPALKKGSEITGRGWVVFVPPLYPEGLYDILRQIYYSYKNFGLKRLYIAENGMAMKSKDRLRPVRTDVINDEKRVKYLKEHIRQVHKAIENGVPVKGYFLLTLMDNYEWPMGYKPESAFGIIYVDRKSMKRVWKKSAVWYQDVLKKHELNVG